MPSSAADKILNYKDLWNQASASGNKAQADKYASEAQKFYKQLRDNGENLVADYLQNNNYENSRNFLNSYYGNTNYNTKNTANSIKNLKKKWDEMTGAGDTAGAQKVAAQAQGLYATLYKNGDTAIANKLQNSDYSQASDYLNKLYTVQGLNPIRPYLYTKGQEYGLSNSDIDNLLNYNPDTGEVSLGGKSLGIANNIVDGTSYWDSQTLDNAFDDYVNRSGITPSRDKMADTAWQKIFNNVENYYNELNNENPFTNEIGRSILAKYDLAGFTAGNNAAASAAASNGGNIDSSAAANAMRNQAALIAMGQEAALNAHNDRLNRAKDMLNQWAGVANDVFNASETAKNNETDRLATQAGVTGYVPVEWSYQYNPFLNQDGTLVNPEDNFKEKMELAREKLKTATTEEEKQAYQALINFAAQARAIKLGSRYNSDGQYSQWDDGDYVYNPQMTQAAREAIQNMDLQKWLAELDSKNLQYVTDAGSETDKYLADSYERQTNAALSSDERIANANNETYMNMNNANNQARMNELAYAANPITEKDRRDWATWINSKYPNSIVVENGVYTIKNNKDNVVNLINSATDLDYSQKQALLQTFGIY